MASLETAQASETDGGRVFLGWLLGALGGVDDMLESGEGGLHFVGGRFLLT